MANSKGSTNVRNLPYMGKQSLLPPKSPYPCTSPSYLDYCPPDAIGSRAFPRARDGNAYHQRTSSENHLIEEQPSWLDELLNEPETPQCRGGGHRRSSSDSFAYIDATDASKIDYAMHARLKPNNLASVPSWGSQELDYYKDVQRAHFYKELNSLRSSVPSCPKKNRACEHTYNSMPYRSSHSSARDAAVTQRSGSVFVPQDSDSVSSTGSEKQDQAEAGLAELKCSSEKKDCLPKPLASEADTKRTKQQFAQRSRVRKLQYIAELERNVQALQVEGSEVSAELEFVNQQSIILSMENKALKKRLESLSHEKLIKYVEHQVLEKEIGRLRAVYQQQQQQQQLLSSSSHQRSTGRDLDSQFARLSLKHESNTGRDSVAGALGI